MMEDVIAHRNEIMNKVVEEKAKEEDMKNKIIRIDMKK